MDFSMFSTNSCITGSLSELRTVFYANRQGGQQKRTSQNNRCRPPFRRLQTFLKKCVW